MVNDTTTLNGALSELGETMADNLFSMGVVDADASDGLTTLSNKILDIEPSISGLDLDTSLILHSSDDECLVGQSIMFWAELKADYDDETATDVDLSGVLTGATVTFKYGNTVLGTGVTDGDGIAYYTHTFAVAGSYDITASFAGTENFDDCVSSSITVSVTYEITITADKPILSFADSDVATITATLSDGVVGVGGETLSYEVLDKDDNVLDSGSDVTDSNGQISFSYVSTGVGDVQVVVYYGIFLQETFVIQDCHYWNDGSRVSDLEIDSNVSCTSNGSYITITTSTSGEKQVWIPVTLANSDNWIYEVEIADTVTGSTNQPIALYYDDTRKWAGHSINGNQWFANSGVNDTYTKAYQVGDVLRITRENGYDKAQVNDHQFSNRQATHNTTFKVGFYTNNGRTQKVKNIKLKAL